MICSNQGSLSNRWAREKARSLRGVTVTVVLLCNCSDASQFTQTANALSESPSPDTRRQPGLERLRQGAMSNFVSPVNRPRVEPQPAAVHPATIQEQDTCAMGSNADQNINGVLASGWLVVHGRVVGTPAARELRIPGAGTFGAGAVVRASHAEFEVFGSCGRNAPAGSSQIRINHWREVFSVNLAGGMELSRQDELDARPRRAPLAEGLERVLIVTPDLNAAGEWLVIASIDAEGGRMGEQALSVEPATNVGEMLANCTALVQREVRR